MAAPGAGHFAGEVFSSELLGDADARRGKLGTVLVTIKAGPSETRRIGEAVGVALDLGRLHVFDARTGLRKEAA